MYKICFCLLLVSIAVRFDLYGQEGVFCISLRDQYRGQEGEILLQKQYLLDSEHGKKAQDTHFPEGSSQLYTLPIVFHVVTQSGLGIPSTQINDAVEYLNLAFANQGYYDPATGVDTEIQFCLAKRDPQGGTTDGIIRINSPLGELTKETEDAILKNLSNWDPTCYINIWVVDEILSLSSGPGVAGYAYLPSSHGTRLDGIVVEARFTGNTYQGNAVLIHEMGHYLGLYHTFEGGCKNDDCTMDGDKVCDTPPDQSTAYTECDQGMNTCHTDAQSGLSQDEEDMIANYMDYSRLECYSQFTQGQKDRMRFFIEGIRSSLLHCQSCKNPCTTPLVVKIDLSLDTVLVCDSVEYQFAGSSSAVQFEWILDGQILPNTKRTGKLAFMKPGKYSLLLKAANSEGSCIAFDTTYIQVKCNFDLRVVKEPQSCIPEGGFAMLEVADVGNVNIDWTLDGVNIGNGPEVRIQKPNGVYDLKVVMYDQKCRDSVMWKLLFGCKEICGNGYDDDQDGLYDCFDDDCCAECTNFYYKACADDFVECIDPLPFTIREKWRSPTSDLDKEGYILCGDVDGDGQVEIVTNDGYVITYFDGFGMVKKKVTLPFGSYISSTIAPVMADVDRDGSSEYFYILSNFPDQGIVRVDYSGRIVFDTRVNVVPRTLNALEKISIHDLNLDGIPEVEYKFNIVDSRNGDILFYPDVNDPLSGRQSLRTTVDILPDGACNYCEGLEIVLADKVLAFSNDFSDYEVVSSIKPATNGVAGVVDWDLDGDLDIVADHINGRDQEIIVWEGQNSDILFSRTIENTIGHRSSPVIGNFDADPYPEVAFVQFSNETLTLLDNDLTEKWRINIDEPSSITPIAFDFHQDGIQELVLRDQQHVLIVNTANGTLLAQKSCKSFTNDERPILADVDGDGAAELITVCATDINVSGWLQAYEGDRIKWPRTRTVNYSYFNEQMGINEDMTIPSYAQQNHLPRNRYQNINGFNNQIIIPHLYDTLEVFATGDTIVCDGDSIHMKLLLCLSSEKGAGQMDVTLYNGDPMQPGTQRILTESISTSTLKVNDCLNLDLALDPGTLFGSTQICCIINDDGSRPLPFDYTDGQGYGGPGECDYLNNVVCLSIRIEKIEFDLPDLRICGDTTFQVEAPPGYTDYQWNTGAVTREIDINAPGRYYLDIKDGCGGQGSDTFEVVLYKSHVFSLPDTLFSCSGGVIDINVPSGYKDYHWSTGSRDSSITVYSSGKVWIDVVDSCGRVFSDTTIIKYESLPDLILPDTLRMCQMDSVSVEVVGYSNVSWQPRSNFSCWDCGTTTYVADSSGWIRVNVVRSDGCSGEDSIYADVSNQIILLDTFSICAGDSVEVKDTFLREGGHRLYRAGESSCDTVLQIWVVQKDVDTVALVEEVCPGDSLDYAGKSWGPGSYIVSEVGPCDTVLQIWVVQKDVDTVALVREVCPGDSLDYAGKSWGPGSYIVSEVGACDTVRLLEVVERQGLTYGILDSVTIDLGDTIRVPIVGDLSKISEVVWLEEGGLLCKDCDTLQAVPMKTTRYFVQVTDDAGCTYHLSILVKVGDGRGVHVPNVFSPNGDNINDVWKVYASDENVEILSLEIYSRWGELVYREGGVLVGDVQGWKGDYNGQMLNPNVFVYKLTYAIAGRGLRYKVGSLSLIW